ncbi:undecaprenyl-diphosphate phosphatase [Calidifontibacter sp. DB0510]|uniref:Undecaprenyl-diphosphatase n=1 Tax=Metallococcus carri TaxID=1656884 RepID=A0A967B256_9MICO|nr:undecaprenyl-diphosphate phosphatase [Metallococcus carri]NHN55900.1 undecaprenyl-diphosphate phosphatase [Metallococcus carri]NOP38412.1 undecaprenyl-diphosphate phosphatase [Calidifontibacter sp. DB2511S]
MSWLQAIVLGLVQGLTEFLPISSSAHQLIVSRLAFGNDGGGAAFTAVTQLGTETAVLIYFWTDIVHIIRQWALSLTGKVSRDDPDARMGWLVIIGTIPIGILGLVLKSVIEGPLRNLWITATMLLVFALILAVADATAKQRKELSQLTWRDGLLYGLFQALALIPGVSRSGGTIAGGLFMGYTRTAATRYSFLLAIPAVLSSGLFELKDAVGDHSSGWGQILIATLLAFGVGYAVIAWLMRYISSHDFKPFVIYRIVLAVALFVLLGVGVLDAAAPTS